MSNLEAPLRAPKYVQRYEDRHGNLRCYFRRKGCARVALPADLGSAKFAAAYDAALNQRPLHRARSDRNIGYVYAVRVIGFDLVKIGYSLDPKQRLVQLENGSGMAGGLDTILTFPAKPMVERELHRKFAAERLFGEWFRLAGPVADWLEANGDLPGRRLARLADLQKPRRDG